MDECLRIVQSPAPLASALLATKNEAASPAHHKTTMSSLSLARDKIYRTVARQLHGVVPCWMCGEHVLPEAATLEHIKPRSEGGSSHAENLAISHDFCNNQRHAKGQVPASSSSLGQVRRT
jgi:5-methylcytosine-specific restriction endonuclease McrA